jgi:hypothetical protein
MRYHSIGEAALHVLIEIHLLVVVCLARPGIELIINIENDLVNFPSLRYHT